MLAMAGNDNRLSSVDHTRDLCAKMYDLQKEGAFCDITLHIGGRSLQLHSVVLASCSVTVAAELTSDVRGDTSCFSQLSELDGDALSRLVQFVYTGELLLDDNTDVAALKLSFRCMGLRLGVQLCDEYVQEKDMATKSGLGELSSLSDVQNLAVMTDEPSFDVLACRSKTNLLQESRLQCHPCESQETGLQMPHLVDDVHVPYIANSDDRISVASAKQTHALDVKPLTSNNDNTGHRGQCHLTYESIGEETNKDINDCSRFEKDTDLATTNDLIVCIHRMTDRYIKIKGSQFSEIEKIRDVNCIARHPSKMSAPANGGCDGVGCRRSGRTKQLPKRYSEDMAWGVTQGHVGVFGKQSETDSRQEDCRNAMENCESDRNIALPSSHETIKERTNYNKLQHHRREVVKNKRTRGNGKVSIISSEVRDVTTGTKMAVSSCKQNSRCIVDTDMKSTSSIQCTAMMRSTSTAQDSCQSNLTVDYELSSDAKTTVGKCDKPGVTECHAAMLSDVHKPGDYTVPSQSKTPSLSSRYKHRKCGICKQTFSAPDGLVAHRKLCHRRDRGPNPRKYNCEECAYIARTEKLLLIHMNDKHGVPLTAQDKFTVHTCHVDGCGYESLYKQYVRRHQEAQHTSRRFICEYCGKELRSKVGLNVHVRIHLGAKPCVCETCGRAFRQASILKCHQRSVHETRPHHLLCHECPYTTSKTTSLDLHRYYRHSVALPSNITLHHCDICTFETVSKTTLECHVRRHLEQQPFECKECHKTFVSSNDLRSHAVWHLPLSERKYQCPYKLSEGCQYVAANNSRLRSHVRLQHTHKDDRPFTCHMCSYKTGVKGNLTKHLRSVHHIEVATHQVRVAPRCRDDPIAAATHATCSTAAKSSDVITIVSVTPDIVLTPATISP